MDRLLTLKEIGALLNVRENTVRRYVRMGKMHAIRPEGCLVFHVRTSELDRFKVEEEWAPEPIIPYLKRKRPGLYKKA